MGFTYTAPGILQQKDYVKQQFTTLFNGVHAMLSGGKFFALRECLWAEAANEATLTENNLLILSRD